MSVNFKTAVPETFTIPEPVSTSKSILRKSLIGIPANENSTFSPIGGTSVITFNISSPSDILIGSESYIRFSLNRAVAANALDGYLSFQKGGAHCLIKRVEVNNVAMGTQFCRDEEYNLHYNVQSKIHQSPEQVNQFGYLYGDGENSNNVYETDAEWNALENTSIAVSAVGVITGVDTNFLQDCRVGDIVQTQSAAGALEGPFKIHSITSNLVMTVWNVADSLAIAHPVLAAGANLVLIKRRKYMASAMVLPLNTTTREYCLQIQNSVLLQNLPLLVMRGGITVSIHLELGTTAFFINRFNPLSHVTADSTTMNYQITNPVFMAMVVTPHNDIRDEYVAQYNSAEGLLYYIPSYRYKRSNSANDVTLTESSVQHTIGARGCRKLYAVQTDSILAGGSTAYSYAFPGLSKFFKYGVTEYYVGVGSQQFPNRPVKCTGIESYEALQHLMNVSQTQRVRFDSNDWKTLVRNSVNVSVDQVSYAIEDTFIMAIDLSRDNGGNSNLTGTDLSNVALDFHRTGAATPYDNFRLAGSCNLHIFVEYDAYLKIQASNTVVMS